MENKIMTRETSFCDPSFCYQSALLGLEIQDGLNDGVGKGLTSGSAVTAFRSSGLLRSSHQRKSRPSVFMLSATAYSRPLAYTVIVFHNERILFSKQTSHEPLPPDDEESNHLS